MGALITGFTWRLFALLVVDHLLVVAGVLIACVVRLGTDNVFGTSGWPVIWRASLIGVVVQLMLHYGDLYDMRMAHDRRALIVGLLRALGAASLVLVALYYWLPQLVVGRGIAVMAAFFVLTLMVAWRLLFLEWLSTHLGPTERLLIVGKSSAAVDLAAELHDRRHSLGVELVGFVDADDGRSTEADGSHEIIGTIADIPALVGRHRVDRVVVSLADARGKFSMNELLQMKLNDGVNFDHLASVYERYTGKIAVENLRPSYLVFSEGFNKSPSLSRAKRTLDITLAVIGLAVFGPIMILVALAVRMGSTGPALYRQERVGQHGKPFTVVKFRSMRTDAEAKTGAVWSQQNDPRVTKVGRILRRTRLDELPQLWNVLRGEMSFVGPRPERPQFVASLIEQIPFYGQRHAVRPGLTGWAQVRHSYGSTVEDALQKLQYDLYYIKHLSIAFDLFIIIETVKTVLVRRGS
jgi:sugar transferase (PEP-CTERM system associated)